eukprot:1490690-Amphidinium_carterae.1
MPVAPRQKTHRDKEARMSHVLTRGQQHLYLTSSSELLQVSDQRVAESVQDSTGDSHKPQKISMWVDEKTPCADKVPATAPKSLLGQTLDKVQSIVHGV